MGAWCFQSLFSVSLRSVLELVGTKTISQELLGVR
jgi:hypothetical protein